MADKVPADLLIFNSSELKVDNSSLTGDETVLGQIAGKTQGEKKNPSPLSVEIDAFVKIIATIAAVTAIFFFCHSLGVGRSINSTLNFAIGVFVAWVPEGLPAPDKTGTLTRNQMTVTKIWSNLTMYSALRNLQNANNPISIDSPGLK